MNRANLCEAMNCDVGGVMDYVPEPQGRKKGKDVAS